MTSPSKLAVLLTAVFTALAVTAQTSQPANAPAGWSVGLDGGMHRLAVDCGGATRCDKTGSAVRLFGARQLNDVFGVELSYLRLSGVSATLVDDDFGMSLRAKINSAGIEAAATARLPLNDRFALTGKLGLASMRTTESVAAGGMSDSISERTTTPVIGFGLEYAVAAGLMLRGGLDARRLSLGDEKRTASTFTGGLAYRF